MLAALTESEVNLDNPTVQRILRAASTCFGRSGYRGASMQDIAKEAGVSKSLVHYHFASKETLFLEVQLLLFRDLLEQVRRLADGGDRTIEHFNRTLEQVLAFLERDLDQVVVLFEFRNVAPTNPAFAERLARFNDEVLAIVVEGIHKTLGPMTAQLRVPPERLARMLRTLLQGLLIDLTFAQDAAERRTVHDTFRDFRNLLSEVLLTREP
jgi:AcrR family transcriptional regulator